MSLLLDRAIPGKAEELCSHLTTCLLPAKGPNNDVAVLAIHRTDEHHPGNGNGVGT